MRVLFMRNSGFLAPSSEPLAENSRLTIPKLSGTSQTYVRICQKLFCLVDGFVRDVSSFIFGTDPEPISEFSINYFLPEVHYSGGRSPLFWIYSLALSDGKEISDISQHTLIPQAYKTTAQATCRRRAGRPRAKPRPFWSQRTRLGLLAHRGASPRARREKGRRLSRRGRTPKTDRQHELWQ